MASNVALMASWTQGLALARDATAYSSLMTASGHWPTALALLAEGARASQEVSAVSLAACEKGDAWQQALGLFQRPGRGHRLVIKGMSRPKWHDAGWRCLACSPPQAPSLL